MGCPPRAGPFGRRGFFRAFSAHFCVTLEHLFFKPPKRRRKICGNLRENGRKNLRTKNLRTKNGRKNLRTKKWAQEWAKSLRTKSLRKNRFEHSVCLEDGSQKKKKHKKHLRQTCAKTPAQGTYPRSGLRSGGTCERTLVRFSFRGNIRMCPRSVLVPGEHPPKPPFWKPPFKNLSTSDIFGGA